MRLCSIASGSSGNCIYAGDEDTHLLVDTGISRKKIEEGLRRLDLAGADLQGILLTHEHIDHIQGLGVFLRKYPVPVYATPGTAAGVRACRSLGRLPEGIFHEITVDEEFWVGGLRIRPFSTSHDANEPSGYRIESREKSVAVATDLGTYDAYTVRNLAGVDALVLEANHDTHMLEVGPYPYPLKQRVGGERGHLSNEASGRLLCEILHDGMKAVVLGHLSKENNYPELARETVKLEVTLGDNPYRGEEIPIKVAKREALSEVVEF